MTGAVGSQMTSAGLLDLMKKDSTNYTKHLTLETLNKYIGTTYNVAASMCSVLTDEEDAFNVLEQLKKSVSRDVNIKLTIEEKMSIAEAYTHVGKFYLITDFIYNSLNSKKQPDEDFYKGIIRDLLEKTRVSKNKVSKEKDFFLNTDYFKEMFNLESEKDSKIAKEYDESSKVLDKVYEKILNNKTLTRQDITDLKNCISSKKVNCDKIFSNLLSEIALKEDDLLKGGLKNDAKNKILNFLENLELGKIWKFYSSSIKGRKIALNELGYQSTGDKAVSYALTGGKFVINAAANALILTKIILAATATLFTHGGAAPLLFGIAATGAATAATSTITGTGKSYIEENLNKSKDSVHPELNVQKSIFQIFKEEGKDGVKKAIASAMFSGLEDVATSVIDTIDPDLINNISEKITNSVSDFFKEGLDKIPNIDATLENVNEYVEHIIKENPGLTKDQISEMVSKFVTDQIKEQLVVSPVTETIEKK